MERHYIGTYIGWKTKRIPRLWCTASAFSTKSAAVYDGHSSLRHTQKCICHIALRFVTFCSKYLKFTHYFMVWISFARALDESISLKQQGRQSNSRLWYMLIAYSTWYQMGHRGSIYDQLFSKTSLWDDLLLQPIHLTMFSYMNTGPNMTTEIHCFINSNVVLLKIYVFIYR